MNQERWSKLESAKKKLEKFQQQKIRDQQLAADQQQSRQDSASMLLSSPAGRRSASLSPRKAFPPPSSLGPATGMQVPTALPFGGASMLPFMTSQSPTTTGMPSVNSSPLRQSQNPMLQQQQQDAPVIFPPPTFGQKENMITEDYNNMRREEVNVSPSFQKRVDLAPATISKSSSTDSLAQEWREKYEKTCDQLQLALQDLSKAKQELEKQVEAKASLFGECSKLKGDLLKVQHEKESLVLENGDLIAKVGDLSTELRQSSRTSGGDVELKVKNQLQDTIEELTRVQMKFHESRQENEVLKVKLKNMETRSIDKTERGSMTDLTTETIQEVDEPAEETDSESLQNSIGTLKKQLAAKTAEFNQLRSENVEMSEQLDQLRLKTVEVIDINAEMTTKLDSEMLVRMKLTRELESLLLLKEEMDNLKSMMRNDPTLSPTKSKPPPFQPSKDDENNTEEEASESTIIHNLQSDNARLKTQVDRLSHLTEQLQMELETVPEYIERYHQERKYLKEKTREKDGLIHRMMGQYNEVLRMLDMYARNTRRQQQPGETSSSKSSLADIAEAIKATESIHREAMDYVKSNESLNNAESQSTIATESFVSVTQFPACPSCHPQSMQIEI